MQNTTNDKSPAVQVGVLMGSSSDWATMQHAVSILEEFGIAHEARVIELARMLGGSEKSEISLAHARELLSA